LYASSIARVSENQSQFVVIDTDIGVDDAVALLLALRTPTVTVGAITTVRGNTGVDQCVRNARYVIELCSAEVPVYRGAEKPLAEPDSQRYPVHGEDGVGDAGLRPIYGLPAAGAARDALVHLAASEPDGLTIVTLGPLTNLALALHRRPALAKICRRAVVMGSAATPDVAEFNFRMDSKAASEVLESGLPITLVPIEISQGAAAFGPSEVEALEQIGTKYAEFVRTMCLAAARRSSSNLAGLPDAIAMAIAIDASIATRTHQCRLEVQPGGAVRSTGAVDHGAGPVVVDAIDVGRYKRMIREACR
jgi:purine nucleosidase